MENICSVSFLVTSTHMLIGRVVRARKMWFLRFRMKQTHVIYESFMSTWYLLVGMNIWEFAGQTHVTFPVKWDGVSIKRRICLLCRLFPRIILGGYENFNYVWRSTQTYSSKVECSIHVQKANYWYQNVQHVHRILHALKLLSRIMS